MPAGAGYLDTQGVRRFGEDDVAGSLLFSDTLNLGQDSISTQLAVIRGRLYSCASSAARDTFFGTPSNTTQRNALHGAMCVRTDKGWTEQYYANLTDNPTGGADTAGWKIISSTPWKAWVPALTNFTKGTGGVITAKWRRVGEDIQVRGKITLDGVTATAATLSGSPPTISLPVDLNHAYYSRFYHVLGIVTLTNASSGASRPGEVRQVGSASVWDKVQLEALNASATILDTNTITNTSPYTLAGSYLDFTFDFAYLPE